MPLELTLHPDCTCRAVERIEVEASRESRAHRAGLFLRYVAELARDTVVLPQPATPERTDGLWKHTCFESFIRAPGDAYYEFNFSPSTQWAAYRFDGYRTGMSPLAISAPRIMVIGGRVPRFEMRVSLDLGLVVELADTPLQVGLSAVIEETDGNTSYWALKHPPGKPDFHHADSFAYELSP